MILERKRIPEDFNMEYATMEILSEYLYPNLGSDQEYIAKNNYGLPKALCILPNKLIIIGTSYGMIVMFSIVTNKI